MNWDKEQMSLREAKLRQMQTLPLSAKIEASKRRIIEWYEHYDGNVCVAFSGGLDSTALLHLVRSCYPSISACFSNTGLEYPEIVRFVKTFDNVQIVRPKNSFLEVIKKYGYPCVSKHVAKQISEIQFTKSKGILKLRLEGIRKDGTYSKLARIPIKWQFLKNAPFRISDKCCRELKKTPMKGIKNPYIGIRTEDSRQRTLLYKITGCNFFDSQKSRSWPLAFWLRKDVETYIHLNHLPYSTIYDMGFERTGCMFCLFGLHLEGRPNRFDKMAVTHPKIFEWCMDGPLQLGEVIKYVYGIEPMLKLKW